MKSNQGATIVYQEQHSNIRGRGTWKLRVDEPRFHIFILEGMGRQSKRNYIVKPKDGDVQWMSG